MKKLQIVFVLVLSLIIVSSNASENEKKVSSECPYISQIHSTVSLDKAKSECPYLSNKSNVSNNCPYSKNGKISESKKDSQVCPYSGKTNSVNKVKSEVKYYHNIDLDKS